MKDKTIKKIFGANNDLGLAPFSEQIMKTEPSKGLEYWRAKVEVAARKYGHPEPERYAAEFEFWFFDEVDGVFSIGESPLQLEERIRLDILSSRDVPTFIERARRSAWHICVKYGIDPLVEGFDDFWNSEIIPYIDRLWAGQTPQDHPEEGIDVIKRRALAWAKEHGGVIPSRPGLGAPLGDWILDEPW